MGSSGGGQALNRPFSFHRFLPLQNRLGSWFVELMSWPPTLRVCKIRGGLGLWCHFPAVGPGDLELTPGPESLV